MLRIGTQTDLHIGGDPTGEVRPQRIGSHGQLAGLSLDRTHVGLHDAEPLEQHAGAREVSLGFGILHHTEDQPAVGARHQLLTAAPLPQGRE